MLRRENSELFQQREYDDDDDDDEEERELEKLLFEERLAKAERHVASIAIKSRIFVFIVGILSSNFVGPFDSSASLQIDSGMAFLQCPAHWDGAFNVRISARGYEYELEHAFFPMVPFVSRIISKAMILNWFTGNEYLAAASAAALFNNLAFVVTAVLLFRLGCVVLKNEKVAMRAALLFCYNPASIFFSVAYSESLFALFSFSGMLILSRDNSLRMRLVASAMFGLATLTRANGSLLGLFSLWAARRAYYSRDAEYSRMANLRKSFFELVVVATIHVTAILAVVGYGWAKYCYWVPPNRHVPRWCEHRLPNIYSFVQERYWNVGFLRYWETKQTPNFILALPAILISVEGIVRYSFRRSVPWPYLVHWVICLLIGVFVMHIQVYTRLIAASNPAFYWFAAEMTMRKSGWTFLVFLYFAFYTMFGTAMFCTYFPWT